MTRDEILAMARDAGLCNSCGAIEGDGGSYYSYVEEIEVFAKLIRAAAKEEDAKICEDYAKENDDDFDRELIGAWAASLHLAEEILKSK